MKISSKGFRVLSLFLVVCLCLSSVCGCKKQDETVSSLNISATDWVLAPDKLIQKYKFEYFSSLSGAIAAAHSDADILNSDTLKDGAVAGVYNGGDDPYILLLKDTKETKGIMFSKNMTVNLGGNTLTFEDCALAFEIEDKTAHTVTFDGRTEGSKIVVEGTDAAAGIFRTRTGTIIVNGGSYVARSSSQTARAKTVYVDHGGTLNMTDCDIDAVCHYLYESGKGYTALSIGVTNYGTAVLKNCEVFGTHSGMQTAGVVWVDGGVYESYGHGGIYFSGESTVGYVKNAELKEGTMPVDYLQTAGGNKAAFYIGGNNGNNIKVYMDNCSISSGSQGIILRGTSNESNNSLYISNSTIPLSLTLPVRIDNNSHRLYIGSGNNFGATDVQCMNDVTEDDLKVMVIETDEVYCQDW